MSSAPIPHTGHCPLTLIWLFARVTDKEAIMDSSRKNFFNLSRHIESPNLTPNWMDLDSTPPISILQFPAGDVHEALCDSPSGLITLVCN